MDEDLIVQTVDLAQNLFAKNYSNFIKEKERTVTVEGEEFELLSFEKMIELTNINDMEVSEVRALKAYANTLKDVLGPTLYDQKGYGWSMLMLSASLTIGKNTEGDLLFLDRHNSKTLCIFRHDDASIFKTKVTLYKLIKAYSE
ncbi:hypothetical protein H5200_04740 [Pseudoalteromonas sp. SG43-7]|uniref:hypothetical protein n=1 Tax=Pseudoalteromonas TaxID=53246 RepID=UPI0015FF0462|nr:MULTISPECIES: hypothetical protein [unclassified Pseudoalteromonas]MBB1421221.1 hypothetical protein [Pseudoalteromonas sp. SG43-7]MBB1469794.1 hypothetical protein [Pseudoalteromonas sp. SG41-5]MBB1478797.1 hypothetical protein [Pseudoalteromonas sp. SG41-2]